jgi:hypothetical protein
MSFTIQTYPEVPAILLTLLHDYDLRTDFPKSYAKVSQLLQSASRPLYYITDLTDAKIDLDMLMQGAGKTSLESGGTFHHPMVKEVLLVSPNDVVHFAAEGLRDDVYGNVRVRVFYSVDEALAYARSQA